MKVIPILVAVFLLSACTTQYKAVAYRTGTSNYQNLMTGDIVHDMASGGGIVKMQAHDGSKSCDGTAKSTGLYDGTLDLTCSDGRTVTGTWTATSFTSGTGDAVDSKGVKYSLVFGLSDHELQQFIEGQVQNAR